MKQFKWISIIVVVLLALTACGQGTDDGTAGDQQEDQALFQIGVIPALTEGDYEVPMNKLEALLDDALPYKVEITVYPDYNGVVEALNFGHIQMAYLGPSTYAIANHRSGAQAIVTQLIDGEPFYNSYILTHADSEWTTLEELLEDVSEVSFAFGDINSTSGSLVPSLELRSRGVFTDENTHEFESILYTGSHDATGQSIQNKHIDAGAIDSAYFNSLVKQGKLDESKFRVIWKSEPLFQYPWAVASDVDDDTIKLLRDTFVAIDDEEILRGFGATGFTIATDADYEAVRKILRETGKLE